MGPRKYALDRGSRLDEPICSRKGWQIGDAALCPITLNTYYYYYWYSYGDFSGPATAIAQFNCCLCVETTTFEQNDLPRNLGCWFLLIIKFEGQDHMSKLGLDWKSKNWENHLGHLYLKAVLIWNPYISNVQPAENSRSTKMLLKWSVRSRARAF